MPENVFDIYQTATGYTAVTNAVRRTILDALAQKDRGLPDLVRITGKAKPTLSSVHMKELLGQNLVEELPHPTDSRKKIYRLSARRIGSSNVPVGQLRTAVKHYLSLGPLSTRLPLAVTFEALAAAPPGTSEETLTAQARKLGELSAMLYDDQARDPVSSVAAFLEQEGLARPLRLDLENGTLDVELGTGFAPTADTERLGCLIAAFL